MIVDHAALPGSGTSATRTLHRIDEAVVIREVTDAGFVLEAEGRFLRHPDDPRTVSSGDGAILTDKFALSLTPTDEELERAEVADDVGEFATQYSEAWRQVKSA